MGDRELDIRKSGRLAVLGILRGNTVRTSAGRIGGAALLLTGLLLSGSAQAGKFGVKVVDEQGKPVVGASVCVGLPGNFSQFGALFTDKDGQAIADVPNVPLVVTVSKTRFSGMRISEPARSYNLVKEVTLSEGVPGPRCRAGSSLVDGGQSSVKIRMVDVVHGPDQGMVLVLEADGDPTEYRLNATEDFVSVGWKRLSDVIPVSHKLAGNEQLYLQLRRYEGTRHGWIESVSRTVPVYLNAVN